MQAARLSPLVTLDPASHAGPRRQVYLDNLRTSLTALVICHHSAVALGGAGSWYYVAPPPAGSLAPVVLTMFCAVNQAFFMSLFFFVSAFFTPAAYDRKGPLLFLKDRFARLGVPLVVYFFFLNPTVSYLAARFGGETQTGYIPFMRDGILQHAGSGPLWFVLTLLILALAYALYRITGRSYPLTVIEIPWPKDRHLLAFVIGIGFVTFIVRLWCPTGWTIFNLQLGYYPLYICMYVFGLWAWRSGWLAQLERAQANRWFAISVGLIVALPIVLIAGGAIETGTDAFSGGLSWQAYLYAAWEPVLCVGISMKLVQVFRDSWDFQRPVSRSMARSAYTAYIIHPFFVVVGTYLVSRLRVDPLFQFAMLCPLAVAACFAVSNIVRQAPLLRRIL